MTANTVPFRAEALGMLLT